MRIFQIHEGYLSFFLSITDKNKETDFRCNETFRLDKEETF